MERFELKTEVEGNLKKQSKIKPGKNVHLRAMALEKQWATMGSGKVVSVVLYERAMPLSLTLILSLPPFDYCMQLPCQTY